MPTFPSVAVVGMHFRGPAAVEVVAAMDTTTPLTLEREPDNAYDAYAIKVLCEDLHIGYIERGQAAWISPLLDDGATSEVEITHFEQRGKNRHPICTITISDES